MSMFSKCSMKRVSQCCGAKFYEENEIIYCHKCHDPCRIVWEGEEMKPKKGAIYCQICAGKLSMRILEKFILRYPASYDDGKGTCWGCGKTIELQKASKIIEKETEKRREND
ncbi:MAG: hypothetical protein ACTSPV_00440 [Candidatus Hodarchaeales archaeon]